MFSIDHPVAQVIGDSTEKLSLGNITLKVKFSFTFQKKGQIIFQEMVCIGLTMSNSKVSIQNYGPWRGRSNCGLTPSIYISIETMVTQVSYGFQNRRANGRSQKALPSNSVDSIDYITRWYLELDQLSQVDSYRVSEMSVTTAFNAFIGSAFNAFIGSE